MLTELKLCSSCYPIHGARTDHPMFIIAKPNIEGCTLCGERMGIGSGLWVLGMPYMPLNKVGHAMRYAKPGWMKAHVGFDIP